jgi:hypothetical protein
MEVTATSRASSARPPSGLGTLAVTPNAKTSPARQVLKFWRARAPSKDSFLFSSFECTGFKYTSEDSSEVTFLLVENYQLTTPVGLRIGREFLDKNLNEDFLVLSL